MDIFGDLTENHGPKGSRNRILLVAYHFGEAGATGGFRWAATVRGLSAAGWQFDVISSSHAAAPCESVVLSVAPPPEWPKAWDAVIAKLGRLRRRLLGQRGRAPAEEAADHAASSAYNSDSFGWVEGLSIPAKRTRVGVVDKIAQGLADAKLLAEGLHWSWRALRIARRRVREVPYRAIVVSSPPHLSQLVGAVLTKEAGIPYVADFRDPWIAGVEGFRPNSGPISTMIERRLERYTQHRATVTVHNTPEALERVAALHSDSKGLRVSIRNGYDDFPSPTYPDVECFRVVFAGYLYPYMDPRPLLRAIRRLLEDEVVDRSRFRLEFLGVSLGPKEIPLLEMIDAYGLRDISDVRERVPRNEALIAQQQASVLVAIDYPYSIAVVMKFYDYLAMRGAMLLLCDESSALSNAAFELGIVAVRKSDEEGIIRVLRDAYACWLRSGFGKSNDPTHRFHRGRRTQEFNELLLRL